MHGGYRQGAGRKVGFAAKNAEEARNYLSARVAEEIEPLANKLLEMAKNGDIRAMYLLFDRAWGKPKQEVRILPVYENSVEENVLLKEATQILNEHFRNKNPAAA
jgi:hypothetical protein